MKVAYISTFPWKTIVTLSDGFKFSSHDFDELFLEMHHAGIVTSEYEWREHDWDVKMFPVLANLTRSTDETFTAVLPNGATFVSKNEKELLETIWAAGATGLVPGCTEKWEPISHRSENGALLFNDHGNKITFDRAFVSDEDIRSVLVHAEAMYGSPLILTGDDPVFTDRMAQIAEEMGIATTR